MAGPSSENPGIQPLLRETSISSISSQSLSSTPTMVSSFSYTLSSSGLDTPPESVQDEEFVFCGDSPTRIDRLDQRPEEHFHCAMTVTRFGRLQQALTDLDRGYESEAEAEDSETVVKPKPRKKSDARSFAPSVKCKTALTPRWPASESYHREPNCSSSSLLFASARPGTPPQSIDLAGLKFHNGSCLGISGITSPTEGYRAVSSPTERKSPFSPSSPPAAPFLRGTALPFSPLALDDTTRLFPESCSQSSSPPSPVHGPRTPPHMKLLPPVPLPMVSPPMYSPSSELRHQFRFATSPSPLSSRDPSPASRTPIPPASLSSRIVMLNRRLSLAPEPPRPKTPPVPPKLVGSSRLDTLMGVGSPASNESVESEIPEASHTINHSAQSPSEDENSFFNSTIHPRRSISTGNPISALDIFPFPVSSERCLYSGETLAYLQLAASNNCSSDGCGMARSRECAAYRCRYLVLDNKTVVGGIGSPFSYPDDSS